MALEAFVCNSTRGRGHRPKSQKTGEPERARYSREHVGSDYNWLVTFSAKF